ncbi:N-terminal phage integrase SAM-like domain-containing protein [uncultured Oscillibacter sp.]|uniref:N-terminal phage integrase SAM-like domain-containing protein n=1 Tax=uncultured Oscillibacter sp. TaxID=876091 RepID=UPI00345B61CF
MVRKRDDGRWEGRIVVEHKKNGDSIFRYLYADTQKELTAKLRQSIDAYQGVELTEQSRMSLSGWLDQWLDRRMAGTVRSDTLDGYRRDLDNHVKPHLGQKQLTKITPADLKDLYAHLLEHGRISRGRGDGGGDRPV